jgi:hypothetical protein
MVNPSKVSSKGDLGCARALSLFGSPFNCAFERLPPFASGVDPNVVRKHACPKLKQEEQSIGASAHDPNQRAMVQVKSNLGQFGPALGYAIEAEGKFKWTGASL